MPNLATHPPRSPRAPSKGYKGEIPFTTLGIPTVFNPDFNRKAFYQDGYQKFPGVPIDRSREISDGIRRQLSGPGDLDELRDLYFQIIDNGDKVTIETRLLRLLQRKIDSVFARSVKDAIENEDAQSLQALVDAVERDPLLAANTRSTDIAEAKALLPSLADLEVGRLRRELDEGPGARRRSQSLQKRRSTVSAKIFQGLTAANMRSWEHTSFNAQTGRLSLVKEVVFEKRRSMYRTDVPSAEFADPDEVHATLREVYRIWDIFRVNVEIVQAHKAPYASKKVDGGEHDDWLQRLAAVRASKLRDALVEIGIPEHMIVPQVQVVATTPYLQYLNFHLSFRHLSFNHTEGRIELLSGMQFQKRRSGKSGYDIPEAAFENPAVVSSAFEEVAKIWKVYKCDIDIVVRRGVSDGPDTDEHKMWRDELHENMGAKIADALVGLGVPEERLTSRVDDVDERGTGDFEVGVHLELIPEIRGGRAERKAAATPLTIDGCAPFEFNGKYKAVGMMNGQTKYRHASGGKETVCFGADGFWYLCHNHSTKHAFFKSKDLQGYDTWKAVRSESYGGLLPTVRLEAAPPDAEAPSVPGAVMEAAAPLDSAPKSAASSGDAVRPSSARGRAETAASSRTAASRAHEAPRAAPARAQADAAAPSRAQADAAAAPARAQDEAPRAAPARAKADPAAPARAQAEAARTAERPQANVAEAGKAAPAREQAASRSSVKSYQTFFEDSDEEDIF